MLGSILKLLKALNSETSPWQLASGIALGLVVGLTPLMSLHNLLFLLLVFILRVNFSAFLLALTFFTGVAYLADVVAIQLGEYLLTAPSLQHFWTQLYQNEFWQLTHFNHTLTLGSLVLALVLFVPVLVASKYFIVRYRHGFMAWINKLKIISVLKGSKMYQLYEAING